MSQIIAGSDRAKPSLVRGIRTNSLSAMRKALLSLVPTTYGLACFAAFILPIWIVMLIDFHFVRGPYSVGAGDSVEGGLALAFNVIAGAPMRLFHHPAFQINELAAYVVEHFLGGSAVTIDKYRRASMTINAAFYAIAAAWMAVLAKSLRTSPLWMALTSLTVITCPIALCVTTSLISYQVAVIIGVPAACTMYLLVTRKKNSIFLPLIAAAGFGYVLANQFQILGLIAFLGGALFVALAATTSSQTASQSDSFDQRFGLSLWTWRVMATLANLLLIHFFTVLFLNVDFRNIWYIIALPFSLGFALHPRLAATILVTFVAPLLVGFEIGVHGYEENWAESFWNAVGLSSLWTLADSPKYGSWSGVVHFIKLNPWFALIPIQWAWLLATFRKPSKRDLLPFAEWLFVAFFFTAVVAVNLYVHSRNTFPPVEHTFWQRRVMFGVPSRFYGTFVIPSVLAVLWLARNGSKRARQVGVGVIILVVGWNLRVFYTTMKPAAQEAADIRKVTDQFLKDFPDGQIVCMKVTNPERCGKFYALVNYATPGRIATAAYYNHHTADNRTVEINPAHLVCSSGTIYDCGVANLSLAKHLLVVYEERFSEVSQNIGQRVGHYPILEESLMRIDRL